MMIELMKVTYSKKFPGLGEKIREARIKSELQLTRLAADAEISVTHWNRIENEKIKDLPLETLRSIEKALGVDFDVRFE
ncbi:MAG: helix-turn-helix transcriptional regulator [Symploca sp. SIO2D2]|nr:helix-turn-helix transcriptional regulator [Symploca sp. SIO2D2]